MSKKLKAYKDKEKKIQSLTEKYAEVQKTHHGDCAESRKIEEKIDSLEMDQRLLIEEICTELIDEEREPNEDETILVERRIESLKKEIRYENRRLNVCAYGMSDLYYLEGLKEELSALKNLI